MTATTMTANNTDLELTLFGGGNDPTVMQCAVFDVDQCKDIATHGMAQGVAGFIYNHNLYEWFNDNYEEIEEYLNGYVADLYCTDEFNNYIQYLGSLGSDDHLDLKAKAVWMYVECKCYEFLSENDIDYWFINHFH